MNKMSRRERKMFNLGKEVGYNEGYAKGLYDGNPFNVFLDKVKDAFHSLSTMMEDPDVIEALKKAQEPQPSEIRPFILEEKDDGIPVVKGKVDLEKMLFYPEEVENEVN